MFAQAVDLALEGIISKRSTSRYEAGFLGAHWLKVKVWQVYDLELCGVELDKVEGQVAALLMGQRTEAGFAYAGRVEIGVPRLDEVLGLVRSSTAPVPFLRS